MSREKRRRGRSRSRRTARGPAGGGPSVPVVPIVIILAVLAAAGFVGFLIWQNGEEASPANASAAAHETDPAPDKAGEYVNLPAIYQGERGPASYGSSGDNPNTAPHVSEIVDYTAQGQPPTGGPHWSGACTSDPLTSPRFCGPAPWGIFREPWEASTLIHNMEHGGTIIWCNTTDQEIIDDLEDFVGANSDKLLVLTPYPQMADERVAITVWARRDLIPVGEYSRERIEAFMDDWYCEFDPEGFC